MRGSVFLIIVAVVMLSVSFVAANINSVSLEKNKNKESIKDIQFSTFTSAVCENKEDFVHCKDEIFVNCNGNISKAIDVAECNGIRLDVQKATGFAMFEKGWKDPRN